MAGASAGLERCGIYSALVAGEALFPLVAIAAAILVMGTLISLELALR